MAMSGVSLGVRAMVEADLPFTAPLHQRALPHGLFADLGVPFLGAYHRSFALSPHGVALVAEDDGWPYGFLLGATDNDEFYRSAIRRSGLAMAGHGAVGLARRPALVAEIARTRAGRYARRFLRSARATPTPSAPAEAGRAAVLHHVAVLPGARGTGAGRDLVEAFVDRAAAAGVDKLVTLTRRGQGGAGGFYERLGWTATGGSADWDRYELLL